MKKYLQYILSGVLLAMLCAGLAILAVLAWNRQTAPVDMSGWYEEEGISYYRDFHGNFLTGWQEIDHDQYYFDEEGRMVTGWQEIDNNRYYFEKDGEMATGWQKIDDAMYYLRANGAAAEGWLEQEGKRYYLHPDGAAIGWAVLDGSQYYFHSDGLMATGITEVEGRRYLFLEDGAAASAGWTEVDGSRYYINTDGSLYTGWLQMNAYNYYFQADGVMAVGELEIDGVRCHFNPHGQQMILVNPWNYLPDGYEVELASVGGYQIDARCAEVLEQMLADCRAAGLDPQICSAYRTQADQEFLYNRKVNNLKAQGYSEEEALRLAGTEIAVPGTSEHQLGLAVDIVDNNNWMLDESQASMPTQIWLMEHCWEYGFILRYPVEKSELTGIIYEPWHYRYVGPEIALELRDSGLCLEEYLGSTQN